MSDFMLNSSLRLPNRFTTRPRYGLIGDTVGNAPIETPTSLGKSTDFGFDTQLTPADPSLTADITRPALKGGWLDGAGLGLQAANIGLGLYSALEQSKMNKFMRGYYGEEMARNKADFNNNVTSTNAALAAQARTSASMRGMVFGSAGNDAAVADTMDKWGLKKFE